MACVIEEPANCSRNLLLGILIGREEVPRLVGLRLIQEADLVNLKSELFLIFDTSPQIYFIEEAPIPAGAMTNKKNPLQATEELHA